MWILHKLNKNIYILNRTVRLLKSMFISMHSILGWGSFCMNYCSNAAWHAVYHPVALLRCNEAQVALIAAFSSSALLGLVSLIFLLTILHLNQIYSTVFSSLRSSLLLVHLSLSNFFLPVNFAFNMLWYSTHWTVTSFSNDPLWLTLFVEGVNDHLLDHCQVSSVPHYCAFKEQEIPTIYTVWMVIYWNSNIIIF